MQTLARVWNDGANDYTEKFNDNSITIKRGGFVEMDYFDAVSFMGQYVRPVKTDTGIHSNHKMLRLDVDLKAVSRVDEHRCQACKGVFADANALTIHTAEHHKDVKEIAQEIRAAKAQPNISTR